MNVGLESHSSSSIMPVSSNAGIAVGLPITLPWLLAVMFTQTLSPSFVAHGWSLQLVHAATVAGAPAGWYMGVMARFEDGG